MELIALAIHAAGSGAALARALNAQANEAGRPLNEPMTTPKVSELKNGKAVLQLEQATEICAYISAYDRPLEPPASNAELAIELDNVADRLRFLRSSASSTGPSDPEELATNSIQSMAAALTANPHRTFGADIPTLLWTAAVSDFERSLIEPGRIVQNLRYDIRVDGDGDGWNVRVENRADRIVQGINEVFISYCSSNQALEPEYTEPGCIAREVVPPRSGESVGDWASRVQDYVCTLTVDGQEIDEAVDAQPLNTELPTVRRRFDTRGTTLDSVLTPTTVTVEFRIDGRMEEFPVHFSSYYCVGQTTISLAVSHPRGAPTIERSLFLPTSGSPWHRKPRTSDKFVARYKIETPGKTVLRPGSGVQFRWEPPL